MIGDEDDELDDDESDGKASILSDDEASSDKQSQQFSCCSGFDWSVISWQLMPVRNQLFRGWG
jgi:hypothetical protein